MKFATVLTITILFAATSAHANSSAKTMLRDAAMKRLTDSLSAGGVKS